MLHPVSRKSGLCSAIPSNINEVSLASTPFATKMERLGASTATSNTAAIPGVSTNGELLCLEFVTISINLAGLPVPGVSFVPFAEILLLHWYLFLRSPRGLQLHVNSQTLIRYRLLLEGSLCTLNPLVCRQLLTRKLLYYCPRLPNKSSGNIKVSKFPAADESQFMKQPQRWVPYLADPRVPAPPTGQNEKGIRCSGDSLGL